MENKFSTFFMSRKQIIKHFFTELIKHNILLNTDKRRWMGCYLIELPDVYRVAWCLVQKYADPTGDLEQWQRPGSAHPFNTLRLRQNGRHFADDIY